MKIERMMILGAAFAAVGSFGSSAYANVSLQNGNFFVGYVDVVYPGGFEPKIERVYNAKTTCKGIFGWNWGSEYETYLTVSADGSVLVHEYCGGSENRFSPVSFKREDLDKAVEELASVARTTGAIGTNDQLAAYKDKLRKDAFFRNDEWEKFLRLGKIQGRKLPAGTSLISHLFTYQYVTKLESGYQRTYDTGKFEVFDETGRLVKIQDKNGNFIQVSYNNVGKPEKVVDNFNRKIFLNYNNSGLVDSLQGENGKTASYKYNSELELVGSKDVDGNGFTYKYSGDKRHNLVEVGYSDKTSLQITYYGQDKFESVKTKKDRDGTLTEYTYDYDKTAPGHQEVTVQVKGSDGKEISKAIYGYFKKPKADGAEWMEKTTVNLDGDLTETVYNEMNLPLVIKRGGEETRFTYDNKGRVTKKVGLTEVTELVYDQGAGKVAKVVKYPVGKPQEKRWSEFQYDKKANLVSAKNSDKKGVQLFYDMNGRIASMTDQNKRKILFKYNENSRPVEIKDLSLGALIKVSYKNNGEIDQVDSFDNAGKKAGRRVAAQVTAAFQNLLEIIRPAGVTLAP